MTYQQHLDRLQYFSLPEGRLAYVDRGEGPAVLLVHGIPTSSWLYRHMIPLLAQAGYRVIAPDLLGFGASDKPKGYDIYSEKNQGQRLVQLMDHLQVPHWTHVCHDGGGLWTWEMLRQNAHRVKKLVLLNTVIYDSGFFPPLRFERGAWARFYTRLYSLGLSHKIMINATLKNGLLRFQNLKKEDCQGYWSPIRKNGHRALYYFFTQTCNQLSTDYHTILPSLNLPTLVIWGLQDKILVWKKMAEEVSRDLRISPENIHLLEQAKHFIQEETPDTLVELIQEFGRTN